MKIDKKYQWLIFFILLLFAILLYKRIFKSDSESNCPIENIVINVSDLPDHHWEEYRSGNSRDTLFKLGNAQMVVAYITPSEGSVTEEAYQFSNEYEAIKGYDLMADVWFRSEPLATSWSILAIPKEISIAPNTYRLECSTNTNVRICWYAARYGNNAVIFNADMIIIKDRDLFKILEAIDRKAQACANMKKNQ